MAEISTAPSISVVANTGISSITTVTFNTPPVGLPRTPTLTTPTLDLPTTPTALTSMSLTGSPGSLSTSFILRKSTLPNSSWPTSEMSETSSGIDSGSKYSPTAGNSTVTGVPTPHEPKFSGGAVAGIAISSFLLGALVALCGFWLFSKRYRGSNPIDDAIVSEDIEIPLQGYSILERADDSQIRSQIQDLGEHIYQHVENHYIMGTCPGSLHREDFTAGLIKCGYSDQSNPTVFTLASLLVNPKRRQIALQSLIAWVILRGAQLDNSEYSLLPDEITGFYHAVTQGHNRWNDKDKFRKSLSRWRQLSAHLLGSIHPQQDPMQVPSIKRVTKLLNFVLQPLVKHSSIASQSQPNNLASIICQGKELGMLLLEQPGTWVFGWETTPGTEPSPRGEIVVLPSLEEIITRGGKEQRRVIYEQDRKSV